ncbi:annexin A2 isoform X1 [Nothobranchius furzeri]|uniref:Transcript variant X1 n=4 Tax=Nothobranchius furzeri TaxID=105023 RepID=A0A9D2Y037_NOTFU|nr:annexin A2 isoform X1 [Nothobranchius furzeri]XP_015829698.1 annexin A2 isoform X1 [Nothobranchius furzeri]KAF7211474.1 transcript variant X2 [Nothobranchius furzeri]KAF7211475.1 transcript variant X1 [Nothobranchius furzeri]
MDSLSATNMWWGTLGTVRAFPSFHPARDVKEIQSALERKDSGTLVRILSNRSNAQRQVIANTFQEITAKDLSAALKKVLSGDLEDLLVHLLLLPEQLEARRLQQAMVGLGTDEETLLEILCTRSGKRLQEIAGSYGQMFRKDLEKELRGETSGDFSKLVVSLLKKEATPASVHRDIQALTVSLNGKKADPGPWIDILTSRELEHLDKVLMGVELENGQTVEELVEKRFSGDLRLGFRVLVQCIQNPEVYLAKRLATMKTPLVHGIMVSHSEEDLLMIRAAFLKLTKKSLYSTLQNHFKGEHLQALLAICRSED